MDRAKFLTLFAAESREHLDNLFSLTLRLEKAPEGGREELLNEMFRMAHSIKGNASMMGFDDIADFAHRLESCLGTLTELTASRLEQVLTPRLTDCFLASVKQLQELVNAALEGRRMPPVPGAINRLEGYLAEFEISENETSAKVTEPFPFSPISATFQPPFPEQNGDVREPIDEPKKIALQKPISLVRMTVSPESRMPAMRAFLAYKKLSAIGPVLSCIPPEEDLRNGRLPNRVLEMTTQVDEVSIRAVMNSLSEVQAWGIEVLPVNDLEPQMGGTSEISVHRSGSATGNRSSPKTQTQRNSEGNSERFHKALQKENSEILAPTETDLNATQNQPPAPTLRVKTELLDTLLDTVGDFIFSLMRLRELSKSAIHAVPDQVRRPILEGMNSLYREARSLHSQVINARMTSLSPLTDQLQIAIRRLAMEQEKPIRMVVTGENTEVDHMVLDILADPLIHLVRNSVDHGIERPEVRRKTGKIEEGTITIAARRAQSNVILEISDDGCGLSAEKLKACALKKGIITPHQAETMREQEAWRLCFHTGLSTAEKVTAISGRGIGMDVVKNAVERVGGTIAIESTQGKGTTWKLSLPYTVAIAHVLMVKVEGERIGIPISRILHVANAKADDFSWMNSSISEKKNGEQTKILAFKFKGALLPIFRLDRLLFSPPQTPSLIIEDDRQTADDFNDFENHPAIVFEPENGNRLALLADDLCGLQRCILRPIRPPLDNLVGLIGVTLQSNGLPAFIVDPGPMVGIH